MDASQQDARQSLAAIENSTRQMKKSISSSYTSPFLVLWGLIWVLGFLGSHFWLSKVYLIWTVLDIIGIFGTFVITYWQIKRADPVKVASQSKTFRQLFWFWFLLFGYAGLWLSFLKPHSGLQMNAFLCTLIMFAYIIMGMWLQEGCLIWLGIGITVTTVLAVVLIPHSWYCLWMAAAAGGPMLGTGLYIRFAWK